MTSIGNVFIFGNHIHDLANWDCGVLATTIRFIASGPRTAFSTAASTSTTICSMVPGAARPARRRLSRATSGPLAIRRAPRQARRCGSSTTCLNRPIRWAVAGRSEMPPAAQAACSTTWLVAPATRRTSASAWATAPVPTAPTAFFENNIMDNCDVLINGNGSGSGSTTGTYASGTPDYDAYVNGGANSFSTRGPSGSSCTSMSFSKVRFVEVLHGRQVRVARQRVRDRDQRPGSTPTDPSTGDRR